MISDAKNVSDYIKEAPFERREALARLRELCKEVLTGYQECMAYGGPAYQNDKGIAIAFASQKNHLCFYCLVHEAMLNNREWLKKLDHGKGVIRYRDPDRIDFNLIRKLLTDTVNLNKKPC